MFIYAIKNCWGECLAQVCADNLEEAISEAYCLGYDMSRICPKCQDNRFHLDLVGPFGE